MNPLIPWLVIPGLTLLLPGRSDWFVSNFSVVGSQFPQNLLLLLWAVTTGRFYHTFTKRTIGQAAPFVSVETELTLTDISVFLLIASVFLPYRPDQNRLLASLHLAMAATSVFLFYLTVTMVDLKLYALASGYFALPTTLLWFAILVTVGLLYLCQFIIASVLEVFLTFFSIIWLHIFDGRLAAFAGSAAGSEAVLKPK